MSKAWNPCIVFLFSSIEQNPGEGHQRSTDLYILSSNEITRSSTLVFGLKVFFSLIVSFLSLFRFDCYEGCIVCVIFAYASLVLIHTKKIISKDKHCVVLIVIHTQTIKDIFTID